MLFNYLKGAIYKVKEQLMQNFEKNWNKENIQKFKLKLNTDVE